MRRRMAFSSDVGTSGSHGAAYFPHARSDSADALGAGEHPHLLEREREVPARYRSLGQGRHVAGFA